MKLIILLCLLVHTNAYRAPLPYGTGVASRAQGIGDPGIFGPYWNWFADDNSVQQMQGNLTNNMSKNYSAQLWFLAQLGLVTLHYEFSQPPWVSNQGTKKIVKLKWPKLLHTIVQIWNTDTKSNIFDLQLSVTKKKPMTMMWKNPKKPQKRILSKCSRI